MNKLELLQSLDLGNSVAEFDRYLEDYFITTAAFNFVISDRYDIIRGTKGSGKSAILLSLLKRQHKIAELQDVILVPATNHQGDPIFRSAFANIKMPVEEAKLIEAWKVYLINVIWTHVRERVDNFSEVEEYLEQHKLVYNPPDLLEKIWFSIKRVFSPRELKTSITDPQGYTYTGEAVLDEGNLTSGDTPGVNYNYIFNVFDDLLSKCNSRLWVLLDRLDDAFPEDKELESVSLKSLLYAYKDIAGLKHLKIKIFLRDDIYNRITKQGFRSLTHVNANAMPPIRWSEEKLLHLLTERMLFNDSFCDYLRNLGYTPKDFVSHQDREILLLLLFREQVDIGPKNPKTFRWIINHVKDGNGNSTPRDIISLLDNARQLQVDEWVLNSIKEEDDFLISPSALKKAWSAVSSDKLETQIFAEYDHLKPFIQKFTRGKAEHNADSLRTLFGDDWREIIEDLKTIGFIEQLATTWKIPFIYREALDISQGKAFTTEKEYTLFDFIADEESDL